MKKHHHLSTTCRQELAEAVGQPLEAMDTVASLMVTAALVASLGAGVRVDRGGSVAGGAQLEYCSGDICDCLNNSRRGDDRERVSSPASASS